MTAAHATDTGSIFLGIDFGMALTKVAAQIRLPRQQTPIQVVIELPDSSTRSGLAAHIPSTVWIAGGRAYAFRADRYPQPAVQPPVMSPPARGLAGLGQRLLSFMSSASMPTVAPALQAAEPVDGVKAALLQEWAASAHCKPTRADATASELVTIKLALVLAHAQRSIRQWIARERLSCQWNTFATCAVPLSGDKGREQRLPAMQQLVERALVISRDIADPSLGMSLKQARAHIEQLVSNPPWPPERSPVRAAPESLAAALFHLQRDGQTEGNWLTVDVGGLTTDTTLFFCNPEYQHLSYYAYHSVQCGTAALAEDLARSTNGVVSEAHVRIAQNSQLLDSPDMRSQSLALRGCVQGAMKTTASRSLDCVKGRGDLFETVSRGGRVIVKPRLRILLLGGGTVHPSISNWISEWKFGAGYTEGDPAVTIESFTVERSRLPQQVSLLNPRGQLRQISRNLMTDTDEAILALAVGLAQPPWDLWPYSEAATRKPVFGPDWAGDERYVAN